MPDLMREWETSFLPLDHPDAIRPPQGDVTMVQCDNCRKLVLLCDAATKDYWNGRNWSRVHFCGEPCHHQWHIRQLNTLGM